MKILFLAGWYPNKEDPTEGIFVKEHLNAVSLFNEVAVIYGREVKKQKKPLEFRSVTEDGVPAIRFTYRRPWYKTESFSTYVKGVLSGLQKLRDGGFRPDLIHANIYFTGVPASIIKKREGVPYVITEHFTKVSRKRLDRVNTGRLRLAMKNAYRILPVCKPLEKAIRDYGITGYFEIVPNTVNDKIFYPPVEAIRNTDDIIKMLIVAGLRTMKNYPFLFSVLAYLKQKRGDVFQLQIVGDGPRREEFRKMVRRLNLENTVRFLGMRTKKEIADLMRGSDFFVLPSIWENLPCVLIESLACGLPAVASDVSGIPEIINRENGILAKTDRVEEFTGALEYMLDHHHDYSRKKIATEARKRYGYETVGRRLTGIYERVLAKKRSDRIV
ncbi:MAG: glycosyltransferase [Candidatus Omnitrophota bacterium]